jgi:hypothetical protein
VKPESEELIFSGTQYQFSQLSDQRFIAQWAQAYSLNLGGIMPDWGKKPEE